MIKVVKNVLKLEEALTYNCADISIYDFLLKEFLFEIENGYKVTVVVNREILDWVRQHSLIPGHFLSINKNCFLSQLLDLWG